MPKQNARNNRLRKRKINRRAILRHKEAEYLRLQSMTPWLHGTPQYVGHPAVIQKLIRLENSIVSQGVSLHATLF